MVFRFRMLQPTRDSILADVQWQGPNWFLQSEHQSKFAMFRGKTFGGNPNEDSRSLPVLQCTFRERIVCSRWTFVWDIANVEQSVANRNWANELSIDWNGSTTTGLQIEECPRMTECQSRTCIPILSKRRPIDPWMCTLYTQWQRFS